MAFYCWFLAIMAEAFSYTVVFSLLSFDIYFMTFCLHQTLFSCSALYMFDSFASKFSFLTVFLLFSCFLLRRSHWFWLLYWHFCRQRQKNQLCVYKKPVPLLNFWYFFCVSDLHVQLPYHCIVWHQKFSFIIPYKALAILMCVYFRLCVIKVRLFGVVEKHLIRSKNTQYIGNAKYITSLL